MHSDDLSEILNSESYYDTSRKLNTVANRPRRITSNQDAYFPKDCFWLENEAGRFVIRERLHPKTFKTILEITDEIESGIPGILDGKREIAIE